MKKNQITKVISFAVAVLLGLVSAQTGIGAFIPAYASPSAQAQIGQAYTSQFGLGAIPVTATTTAPTTATTPTPTLSAPVNPFSAAGQIEISQNMAKQFGVGMVGGAFGPAGQAKINSDMASQFGVPPAAIMGVPATTTGASAPAQSGVVSLVATSDTQATTQTYDASQWIPGGKAGAGATQDWATMDWASLYGPGAKTAVGASTTNAQPATAPPESTTPTTSNLPGSEAAVSLLVLPANTAVTIDPILAAKIAQVEASFAAKQAALEMEQERIELEMELGLLNELSAIQAAHQASITAAANAATVAVQTATPVVAAIVAPISAVVAPTATPDAPITVAAAAQVQNQVSLMAMNSNRVAAGTPLSVIPEAPAATIPVVNSPVAQVAAPVNAPAQPISAASPVAASPLLMTEAQIFTREQQLLKEIEVLKTQRLKNSVAKTLTNYQAVLKNQMAEFQLLLDSTVAQLKCDATCVSTCVTAATTPDAKALCLETCLCYATPAVPVVPAAPIVAPVTPVVTPIAPVATPSIVEAAPTTPAVDTVIENAEPAAAAQQTVVLVDAAPVGAQQALFLTEEAIVMSANGSLSGIVVLAGTIALITLIGAALLHFNDNKKSIYRAFGNLTQKKTEAFQESEEYLLIK